MSRAEVRQPRKDGLQTLPDEVGHGNGGSQRKAVVRGHKKEVECTPMVMGSPPMANKIGEKEAPAVAGSRVVTSDNGNPWNTRDGGY